METKYKNLIAKRELLKKVVDESLKSTDNKHSLLTYQTLEQALNKKYDKVFNELFKE